MRCAWQAFLNLLPLWMRQTVDAQGKETLMELRLRLNQPPELVTVKGNRYLERKVFADDLSFVVNSASRYSPWAAASTAQGYITAPGGHRIGLCGVAINSGGKLSGIREVSSLCIRVSRDFPGISKGAENILGSILIIGSPGSGKTTLLRDLIRQRSDKGTGSVAVVDEREEIFPMWHNQPCFPVGRHTDVLCGCSKASGVEAVLRCMGPETIAVDEITAQEDCEALLRAGWCGVSILATAHAGSVNEFMNRPVYKPITDSQLFDTVMVLQRDKSWKLERMKR